MKSNDKLEQLDIGQILIRISKEGDWSNAKVEVKMTPNMQKDKGYLMCAIEYLMSIFVKDFSKLPEDKAYAKLVEGAKTYSSKIIKEA